MYTYTHSNISTLHTHAHTYIHTHTHHTHAYTHTLLLYDAFCCLTTLPIRRSSEDSGQQPRERTKVKIEFFPLKYKSVVLHYRNRNWANAEELWQYKHDQLLCILRRTGMASYHNYIDLFIDLGGVFWSYWDKCGLASNSQSLCLSLLRLQVQAITSGPFYQYVSMGRGSTYKFYPWIPVAATIGYKDPQLWAWAIPGAHTQVSKAKAWKQFWNSYK